MSQPAVTVYAQAGEFRLPMDWLQSIAAEAMPEVLSHSKGQAPPLRQLQEIEVSLVADREIAKVHGEFLNDSTPTDVITFHHGEILISFETAERQGTEHGQPRDRELALYLIHGLMHLAGWDDHDTDEAREMARIQSSILEATLLKLEP